MRRLDAFLARLGALPIGHSEGAAGGRRYGMTLHASPDGRRRRLYAEERGGPDRISANLYLLADGRPLLRPCEMPAEKVIGFVLEFRPDGTGATLA